MESLIIVLHIFSGLRDPQWEINSSHESFAGIHSLLASEGSTCTAHPSILGYRGFTVELMFDGKGVREYLVGKKTAVELERKLIDSAPEELRQRLGGTVLEALADC